VIADKSHFNIEPLGSHDRAAFCCGRAALDQYLREQASQDVKRRLASVFVVTSKDDPRTIVAYYTLSSRELSLDQLPPEMAKSAGRYGRVGVTLLGRMAVAARWKGTGLGSMTLMDALYRSLAVAKEVASWAVFVEAIDAEAAQFYRKYGFMKLPEDRLRLFLTMKTIAKSFAE